MGNDNIDHIEYGHDVTSISDLVSSYIFRFSKLYGQISLVKVFYKEFSYKFWWEEFGLVRLNKYFIFFTEKYPDHIEYGFSSRCRVI